MFEEICASFKPYPIAKKKKKKKEKKKEKNKEKKVK